TPVPGHWGSVVLRMKSSTGNLGDYWLFQCIWTHGTNSIQTFSFYTWTIAGVSTASFAVIAVPILGDTLQLTARPANTAGQVLTAQAYLSNFDPFSIWARQEWLLLHREGDAAGPGNIFYSLPLFAGQVDVNMIVLGLPAGQGEIAEVRGWNAGGTDVSGPVRS